MDAGLDWTGTPSLNEPHPYGPCLIGVRDREQFDAVWSLLAVNAGIGRGEEIKGHKSPPHLLANVLRLVLANEVCVNILLLDKRKAIQERAIWPVPPVMRHQTALHLADEAMQRMAFRLLLCDEDIRGKGEQQHFKTAVLRCNARLQPANRMKLGFWPSEKSNLIQCADVIAYVAARSLRENALTQELQTLWGRMQSQAQTSYKVLQEWNE